MVKKLLKKLWRSGAVQTGLTTLAAGYIWLIYHTTRWRIYGADIPQAYWKTGRPFILCFWHGRLLMMPYAWSRSHPIDMLISSHRDGQLIARTVAFFGINTVQGSTAKGGTQAVRHMLRALRAGTYIGITPDGPRGPRYEIGGTLIALAQTAGVDILPLAYATSRRKILSTWDHFHLPLPFGRGAFVWGQPFSLQTGEREDLRQQLTRHMNQTLTAAEEAVGYPVAEVSA